jgi:anti-sigma regulatory factor (Ser/Thr protein kinase)
MRLTGIATDWPDARAARTAVLPTAAAPGEARRLVHDLLAESPLAGRSDDLELAASELVTNALLHGRPPLEVVAWVNPRAARIEVHDASPLAPTFSLLEPSGMTGRGLLLVDAATDAFGVDPEPGGKVVWCEVRDPDPAGAAAAADVDALLAAWGDDLACDPADEVVTVVLTDLDTETLAASEAHSEALLRDLALVLRTPGALSDEEYRAVQRAVAAAEAFEAGRAALRHQVMLATAEGAPTVEVRLRISRREAELVREYAAALDEADRMCRSGRLLVSECPRELSHVREGYLRRIVAQLTQD